MKIDPIVRLQHAATTIAMLRQLKAEDRTITYGDLAKYIGLIPPGGTWNQGCRRRIANTLGLAVLVAAQCGEKLDRARIVVAATGRPGSGANSAVSMVIESPGIRAARTRRRRAAARAAWVTRRARAA